MLSFKDVYLAPETAEHVKNCLIIKKVTPSKVIVMHDLPHVENDTSVVRLFINRLILGDAFPKKMFLNYIRTTEETMELSGRHPTHLNQSYRFQSEPTDNYLTIPEIIHTNYVRIDYSPTLDVTSVQTVNSKKYNSYHALVARQPVDCIHRLGEKSHASQAIGMLATLLAPSPVLRVKYTNHLKSCIEGN